MTESPEYLKQIFTSEVLHRLASISRPSKHLKYRLNVLTAHGPKPTNSSATNKLRYFRAQKAAWEVYIAASFVCGFFESAGGSDLRERLIGEDDDGFRSGMAECMACWFFAGKHGLVVTPYPVGRPGKNLDMLVKLTSQDVHVEVKAPYRKRPTGDTIWHGEDSDAIANCVKAANKQFSTDRTNILVIAPELRLDLYGCRFQLVKACFGQEKITALIDKRTGGPAGPVGTKFFPDGKFLNPYRPNGKHMKPDGQPAFTRVSAVITIEEVFQHRYPYADPFVLPKDNSAWLSWKRQNDLHYSAKNYSWIEHQVLVAYNPFARHPLSTEVFEQHVRFMDLGKGFGWTDGHTL